MEIQYVFWILVAVTVALLLILFADKIILNMTKVMVIPK